jgi:hypothetical protein
MTEEPPLTADDAREIIADLHRIVTPDSVQERSETGLLTYVRPLVS